MLRIVVALGMACAVAAAAQAHPLAPSLLELREGPGGVAVTWKTPLLRPRGVPTLEPVLPARCTAESAPPVVTRDRDGVRTVWRVDCGDGGLVGARVAVAGIERSPLAVLVRVTLADGRLVQGLLSASKPVLVIPPRPQPADVLRDYVRLGVEHILLGPDHLLFVFGLVLLAHTTRRLVGTVSAFTLGHSVTLSLAVLGYARVPQQPVEVAIAFSVFVLAVELARDERRPTLLRSHPWAMAAGFGLLHGLGFAAALRAAGLPDGDVPLALLAFNVGIELGQLAFVLAVVAVRWALRDAIARLPGWTRWVPVYGMGTLAAAWWIERALDLGR